MVEEAIKMVKQQLGADLLLPHRFCTQVPNHLQIPACQIMEL